jgi:circadian clock protein KaiC
MPRTKNRIIPTGVPSLDLLLGGGIPSRQSVVVTGDPGTGKTILCSQVVFAHAAQGERTVVATVASESHDKLLDELQGFSFFEPERVGDQVYVVSAYPALQKGPREARDLLLGALRERKARILFVDGLRSLRDLWANESKLRDFMYELNVGIAQMDAIALLTTEYPLQKLLGYPEATTVDCIIALTARHVGGRVVRRAQVAKLRGRPHLPGEHLMHITGDGIHIVPRLEEIRGADADLAPTGERAEFGLPELDALLHGGLPVQSTTVVAGSTGVGKTLLSLHFLAAGARRGEPGLHVSYSEPVKRLVARARAVALDLAPLLDAGGLHLVYRPVTNVEGDDLVAEILAGVRRHGIKRLVIDGIGDLEASILDRERVRPLLTALIVELRDAGVTSIFVKEVAKIVGPELDFSDTPISVTAENVLFFRYLELRGRMHRAASVLKMRESGYDPYLREFEVTPAGLRVLDPVQATEGLLTGVARVIGSEETGDGQGAGR